MKVLAVLVAALFLFSGLGTSAGKYSDRRAPGFSLADLTMQQHDPQDYRGKVLLIDVMTTTCAECQKLTKTLRQLEAKHGSKLAVISIVTMPDTADTVKRFIKDYSIDWPIVFDCGQVIASYLKVTPANPSVHFPHLFLVDPAGVIRADYGDSDASALTVDSLSAEISKHLK